MKTLEEFEFNGYKVLEHLITPYVTVNQAIASLSVFTHPDTVKELGYKSLFSIVRAKKTDKRGSLIDGKNAIACDNTSTQLIFCWANGWPTSRRIGHHLQFNHVYDVSDDPKYYTSLSNICVTPACVAKLTDGKKSEVKALLKYHIWRIYNEFVPEGELLPQKPLDYDKLEWANYPSPVDSVETVIRQRLTGNPKKAFDYFGWSPYRV